MQSNRRKFITGLGTAAMFVPQTAFGANDRITYAAIATGGRGRGVSRLFSKLGAQCLAICDVYQPHLDLAQKDSPDAKPFGDYHELLSQTSGLDAVMIASPDHQHFPMLKCANRRHP